MNDPANNWLAARLCRFRSEAEKEPLSRPYGTLHGATAPLHAATPPYTPAGPYTAPSALRCRYWPSFSARTRIQWPPMTLRALKPTIWAVFVSYQSLVGTRLSVSFM